MKLMEPSTESSFVQSMIGLAEECLWWIKYWRKNPGRGGEVYSLVKYKGTKETCMGKEEGPHRRCLMSAK